MWLHGTKAWPYSAPALFICLTIWHFQSKATCEKTMGKIQLNQTNSPILTNSAVNNTGKQTILTTTSANHPGHGITLRDNRSTSQIPSMWGTRARSERPPAAPEKYTEVLGNNKCMQNFRFLTSSKHAVFPKQLSCESMAPRLGHTQLRRYAFIWRYGTTNQKPHAKNYGKNTVGPNEFTDFEKFGREHYQQKKQF